MQSLIHGLIIGAGAAQIVLCLGSLSIPRLLKWHDELSKVRLLIRQMFWTYAAYILTINLCFGLVSVFAADELLSGSRLAVAVTGFIALYWTGRVLIQFFYFDRADFPAGKWYLAGEAALVGLFISLSIIYGWACYINWGRL
jgi:hypothetical protein